ncbi:hypothetical protein GLOIN_2v1880312 [Rhizophagus irregularis DAOM 181602=DAOM 197198]|uniref:Galactose oxidase n=1 Tax=Rhizophagus irregularis (strain DAOM 181602 / DAOM 197198 / MUCL 43194) TaxID=747089 RepID=A0A2P4PKC7_RHIID|nr:hypothetical protein GLOIN_2v1880312 [Rhizophagus irregularis DAOM 181602=DAOM 197198]POG65844.1 hypothetical protein GLOIN_2v1880312 [Rhizophagus irregularis DAOM 181602=DAOM 197198]CAG8684194.1 16226_t:CDS:2 [Rhizophagus irregularis]|eukprot:XP_025172710.1 hypothetical protein GLOIN_2v1880312 [Rhizophagus irregularis DAOM 181602=DAOM 197198]
MEHIYIYGSGSGVNNGKDMMDIINTTKTHCGIKPSPRYIHTTVLTQDGLIIIYGGSDRRYYPVPNQISVLDTNVTPFNWSTPSKINTAPSSAPFGGHTATLVGNYMIAFVYPTKSHGIAHAAIIGGTTGGIATIIITISVSYLLYRRKRTVIYAPQAKHAINC